MIRLYITFFLMLSAAQADLLGTFQQWKILLQGGRENTEAALYFLEKHPDWPQTETIAEKTELFLSTKNGSSRLLSFFGRFPPKTIEGATLYTQLLIDNGQLELAKSFVKKFWKKTPTMGKLLRSFHTTFQDFLENQDHLDRANHHLYLENLAHAEDMLMYLPSGDQDVIKARVALLKGTPNALNLLSEVKVFAPHDVGLIFEEIRYYRKQKQDDTCLNLLNKHKDLIKTEESMVPDPWWTERNILARRLLEAQRYKDAVTVIKPHALKNGENYANAEWIKGWLTLSFLKKPATAFSIFEKLYATVGSPISRARAAFWAAESSKSLGKTQEALSWYTKAAAHAGTFYGQMAISRLTAHGVHHSIASIDTLKASAALKQAFYAKDFVKLIKMLYQTESDEFITPFFLKLSEIVTDADEQKLLVDFAASHGGRYKAVLTCKKVTKKVMPITQGCFPDLTKSTQKALARVAEHNNSIKALVHALIRQESRFDSKATSHAGAQGLMQLMPKTAQKEVTRAKNDYRLTFPAKKTLYDEEKNVLLGTIHIMHLLKKYDGSLILAIAAYNAGATAVNSWIEQFGDPRTMKDVLNWLEKIPFMETRNYVQRVMENFVMYMAKFSPQSRRDLAQFLVLGLRE